MPLPIGTRLGSFVIEASIGAGGMGEVYRARDSKLGRDVAIKVLPELFSSDGDRLARFEREARVLASLNHPNIAHIYGVEDSNGTRALVMELVEGQTLADVIAASAAQGRGMAIDEAAPIAIAVAEALEAAHDQGIIHRDLKPANVKVRPDGGVKVLDFGLAKALEASPQSSVSAMMSPTISIHGTQAGIILGTAAYMSPEQARGKAVDRRADIWAFGVVLFEMLAGRRPFDAGEDVSDQIAGVLKSEPAWQALPGDVPITVRRLLRRCLHKDPRQRLQHIGDARVELQEMQREADSGIVVRPRAPLAWRERAGWLLALVLVGIASAVAFTRRPLIDVPEIRAEISTPPSARPSSFAISPDGRTIVYNADGPNGPQLWLRSLNSETATPLPGTDVGQAPFWSPDGRFIGFFSNNRLKYVDVVSGQVTPLTTVITPAGGTWNSDDTILFVRSDNNAVFRIAKSGGAATQATPKRSPELATRMPQFLPDGRHYLFYVARGGEPSGVYIGELGSESITRILENDSPAMYGIGQLWFVQRGTLFAQPFNLSTQRLGGQPARIVDNVGQALYSPAFSVSAGHVAYRTAVAISRRLRWFNRSGSELSTVGEEGRFMSNPSLSRDGRYVAVQRTDQDNIDLWTLDLTRDGDFVRRTVSPEIDAMPLWSADGKQIAYNTIAKNATVIAIKRLDGSAPDEVITPPGTGARVVCDWSVDGRFILYKQFDDASGTFDLWALPMQGERAAFPVVQGPSDDRDGQFSPDGKWIAYDSDESGHPRIYVQPFPGPGRKEPVSSQGGSQPRWRSDGRELFYVAPDGYLMSVPMVTDAGPSGIGKPVRLFRTRFAPFSAVSRQQYVVSKDGQRFLMIASDDVPTPPISLILNWKNPARH